MNKPSFVYVTYIRSTPANVWRALTDPEITQHYWNHRNLSDWSVGSAWDHQRCDGSKKSDVTGTVVESTPAKRLVVTWASPSDAADAQHVSRVTFDIEPYKNDSVRLTVTHDHLQPGSAMERGITQGWPLVLSALKSWLETGKALPL
jgi:uncharacterized protein YndB with AHSA1/START domain